MRSVGVMFCLFLVSFPVFAQSDRGMITGTVSDATGGVSPGVSVNVFRSFKGGPA